MPSAFARPSGGTSLGRARPFRWAAHDRGDRAARASPHQTRSPPPHHLDKCAVKVGAPAEAPVLAQMFGRSSCPLKWPRFREVIGHALLLTAFWLLCTTPEPRRGFRMRSDFSRLTFAKFGELRDLTPNGQCTF